MKKLMIFSAMVTLSAITFAQTVPKKMGHGPVMRETGFHKQLSFNGISFDIKTYYFGDMSIVTTVMNVTGLKGNEKNITNIRKSNTDPVIDAQIADLDGDGFPEVLLFTQAAGSGSYGGVIAYSVVNGKSVSEIAFPNITKNAKAKTGYMGHDSFKVENNQLFREFPVYKPKDSNSNPTGGSCKIRYTLSGAAQSKHFRIAKIVNSN